MNKTELKWSIILSPVPVVLVASSSKKDKNNVFTILDRLVLQSKYEYHAFYKEH